MAHEIIMEEELTEELNKVKSKQLTEQLNKEKSKQLNPFLSGGLFYPRKGIRFVHDCYKRLKGETLTEEQLWDLLSENPKDLLFEQKCTGITMRRSERLDHEGIHVTEKTQIAVKNMTVNKFMETARRFNETRESDMDRIKYTINIKYRYIEFQGKHPSTRALLDFTRYLEKADNLKKEPEGKERSGCNLSMNSR